MEETHDEHPCYIIGVDVGGTNTDAVILKMGKSGNVRIGVGGLAGSIVSAVKSRTTADFCGGIQHAIVQALRQCTAAKPDGSRVSERDICAVMIGTTVFLNAVLQSGEGAPSDTPLTSVVCIRLCGRLTRAVLPFATFRPSLARQLQSKVFFVDGGYEFDKQLVAELDETHLTQIARELAADARSNGTEVHIALSGVFSPLYHDQEVRATQILEQELTQAAVRHTITASHKIGQVGFVERENATILNASLRSFAARTMGDLNDAVLRLGLNCSGRVYLTQNDGTLLSLQEAIEYPVLTFSSGPVNSLRGASALTGLKDAIVVDIGGTSTDVAVLNGYFPRPAGSTIEIAGVRTNFRMPDVFSIGLGGGSLVAFEASAGQPLCSIGPASVGYKLLKEAQCFGGKHLTLTDVAVARGVMQIDGADASKVLLSAEQAQLVESKMLDMLERAVDRMKTSKHDVALVLVGGGSGLLRDGVKVAGASEVHRPANHAVANALGAALAQVSVTLEEVHDLTGLDSDARTRVQRSMEDKAQQLLLKKGALPDGVQFVLDKVHVSYVQGECMRFITKAVGYLDVQALARAIKPDGEPSVQPLQLAEQTLEPYVPRTVGREDPYGQLELRPPKIVRRDGRREWHLSAADVHCMALGAGITACGGGGSTFLGRLEALKVLNEGYTMRIIDVDALHDDDQAMFTACYGAPFVLFERCCTSEKAAHCFEALRDRLQVPKLAAVYCAEIGGLNSLVPLCVGARLGLPVLDCDVMGRAYPQLQMTTQFVYGDSPVPCCLSGEYGPDYFVTEHDLAGGDAKKCELMLRAHATAHFGLDAAVSCPPATKQRLAKYAVRNTMSRIWRLGRIILQGRNNHQDMLQAIERQENGKLLFTGKIIDLTRLTQDGYNKGVIEISGLEDFVDRTIKIEFMNENLVVLQPDNGSPRILASVPDLICVVDLENFHPILTEELRYGLRVRVIVMPANPLLCTPEALKILGPEGFGYEHKWEQCSLQHTFGLTYQHPVSVFDEFPEE